MCPWHRGPGLALILGIVFGSLLAGPVHAQVRAQQKTTAAKPKLNTQDPNLKSVETLQKEVLARHLDLIELADTALDHLRWDQRNCRDCHAALAAQPNFDERSAHAKCGDKWQSFYSKEEIDIRVVFGYFDASGEKTVDDVVSRQSMIDQLTRPCSTNVKICGFKRSDDDGELLEKNVEGFNGKTHKVKLRIVASALSASDVVNRSLRSDQEEKSAKARKTFMDGIDQADALFYIGHARDGGGPDFSPAILKDGKIDYEYYRTKRPGLEALTEKLSRATKTPKILGFLACNSERWSERLSRMAKSSGLLLSGTDNIAQEVAVIQALGALDSILWKRCADSFEQALNPIPGSNYAGVPIKRTKLTNFFK